ncbi:unnamed protein product [Linum tenue]|uniref:Uncharacterized protein n=1 Tax=Linum tenue TaxID=586396 RepID=A0AAV0I333_9ROSI|nr:unnamed protein product [Linum tenue]
MSYTNPTINPTRPKTKLNPPNKKKRKIIWLVAIFRTSTSWFRLEHEHHHLRLPGSESEREGVPRVVGQDREVGREERGGGRERRSGGLLFVGGGGCGRVGEELEEL